MLKMKIFEGAMYHFQVFTHNEELDHFAQIALKASALKDKEEIIALNFLKLMCNCFTLSH